jgi:hypothetical protein
MRVAEKLDWKGLKRVIGHKMYVLIFLQLLFETFLILGRTKREVNKNVFWSSCKVPVIIIIF